MNEIDYRVVKHYYRGGEEEIRHRFYIEKLTFTWKTFFTGRYYWIRVRELVGGFGDCWYEDRSYDDIDKALDFVSNIETPLPKDEQIKKRPI